jgi:hypothetical protein
MNKQRYILNTLVSKLINGDSLDLELSGSLYRITDVVGAVEEFKRLMVTKEQELFFSVAQEKKVIKATIRVSEKQDLVTA